MATKEFHGVTMVRVDDVPWEDVDQDWVASPGLFLHVRVVKEMKVP